ncbi:MAG TPA: AAA family ATPase [Pyrinomonadaceae bacterium]|nr:AAA family ATPase [Pyrinomonadaceae bacterium]HMP64969.1 AAA family ATPase [Pyrinomonadaceae bacterium]
MRVRSVEIENFRAIEKFSATGLSDFVVIAGPNGCGKSTVLDALRLLKSLYVYDEWKRWMSEFGINVDQGTNFKSFFRDASRPAILSAVFELSSEEHKFLSERASSIALAIVMTTDRTRIPVTGEPPIIPPTMSGSKLKELHKSGDELANAIRNELLRGFTFHVSVNFTSEPAVDLLPSPIATAAFSCFNPQALGEIEFHGSRRVYTRESVSNIRLRVGDRSEERRNRFLYDWENKYKNVKTQLGEEYVAAVLRNEDPDSAPLQTSIKELFRTFFPGKEFAGVTFGEDNALQFPVILSTGEQHDIDELSSGEKEIVYGYLWLRTGTPHRSVILVDEPELHLNPALVQGLTAFYKTHLADALDAQVWIVTHSDAILRQAVRARDMAVFHMARALGDGTDQCLRIDRQDAVEAAVLDLIGDLAAYRPHARIVLVEGHKETRFDVDMIRRLFPDMAERGNFIATGNRRMTVGINTRLREVLQQSGLTGRAVSICDGDLGLCTETLGEGQYLWPAYEIENFLLEPRILRAAASALLRDDPFDSDEDVVQCLRELATSLVGQLALIEVQYSLNEEFVSRLSIGGAPENPVPGLIASAETSARAISEVDVSHDRIEKEFDAACNRLREATLSDDFLTKFPGDRLLRALAGRLHVTGEHFRNACLDQAVRLGVRPHGMEKTLRAALSSTAV